MGSSLSCFFPTLPMARRNSVTPPFSQLPTSTTGGRFFPREERRLDTPFPQLDSRFWGFKRPYLARPMLAQPSETQKTSLFNSSRASETISLSWVNLTLLHPPKTANPLIFPPFMASMIPFTFNSFAENPMTADSLIPGISLGTPRRAPKAFCACSTIFWPTPFGFPFLCKTSV